MRIYGKSEKSLKANPPMDQKDPQKHASPLEDFPKWQKVSAQEKQGKIKRT
jgi:hypothetical protein